MQGTSLFHGHRATCLPHSEGRAHLQGWGPELRVCLAVVVHFRWLRAGGWWLLPHNGLLGVLFSVQAGALGQTHPPHHLPGGGQGEGGGRTPPALWTLPRAPAGTSASGRVKAWGRGREQGTHPRLPALDVRRRSRERWRPWARRSASCLCFSSSSLARTSSSPHRSAAKWAEGHRSPPAGPLHREEAAPSSPRGVSSIRDFPLRSAPCATSSSTRCTCGPASPGC